MTNLLRRRLSRPWPWILAWLALIVLGSALLSQLALDRLQAAFDTDARIVHRLLSQRVVQHDAVMATLALLQPADDATQPGRRLSSVYPQILDVRHRAEGTDWRDGRLAAAEVVSRAVRRPVLAHVDFAHGRYSLVLAAGESAYALDIDLRGTVPWSEWPMAPETSPVRVTLEHEGQRFTVQHGQVDEPDWGGWLFEVHKHLAAESQPFDVVSTRRVGLTDLPWGWMAGWAAVAAGGLAALAALLRQREQRRRAEELLRLGQVARLNTLGELAAGMAHELNQPLTAVLANTQAAGRLLAEEPPDIDTARHAMSQAVEQARRASTVVARLRRSVERPDLAAAPQTVDLGQSVRDALYLLEPEFARRGVSAHVDLPSVPALVLAEPVALEQVIHNLLMNALQALDHALPGDAQARQVRVGVRSAAGVVTLAIADNGPGIAPDVLPRIFEPFFTTRIGGLGLGLSLCETLASGMGGSLAAAHNTPRGAVFRLMLPASREALA
ncbi:MAG: two-component sensor histidine kinase [Comamonadaceae bacterium]|nr:MAG: two-component sensor histidine kinase [Comamonadaceae bacterium]